MPSPLPPPPTAPRPGLAAWVGRDPDRRMVLGVAWLSVLAVGLVVFRHEWTERATYDFLHWNLFLAWVPIALAAGVSWAARRPRGGWAAWPLGLAWLAFFPNAPYIVTDLMHLRSTRGGPLWLDVLMVSSVALAGLLAGLASLRLVHGVVTRAARSALVGWAFAAAACLGAGFGVYLGRFQRWNSWDIVTRPTDVLTDALVTVTGPRAVAFTAFFGLLLLACYAAVTAFGPRVAPEPREPAGAPPADVAPPREASPS